MTYTRDSVRHELALLQEELRALDSDIAGVRSSPARSRDARVGLQREAPAPHGETVELPGGVLIRAVEPEDAGEISRGLERLSRVCDPMSERDHDGIIETVGRLRPHWAACRSLTVALILNG